MILFCVLNIVQTFCSIKSVKSDLWRKKTENYATTFLSSGWGRRKHCTRRQSDAPGRLPLPFLSIIVILHLLTIIRNYPARKKTIISPKSSQTNSTLQKVSVFGLVWGILGSDISQQVQYPLYIYGIIKHKWDGTRLRWRFNLFTIRKKITI